MRVCSGGARGLLRSAGILAAWLSIGGSPLVAPAAEGMTLPGTRIVNVATVTHTGAGPTSAVSNDVTAVVALAPTLSALRILRYAQAGGGLASVSGPTFCAAESGVTLLPPPVLTGGATLDPAQLSPLIATASLHGGEPAFLELRDLDQNLDAAAIDVIELEVTTPAGDRERLRLSESAVNSGVFVGYVQTVVASAVAGNCVLEVELNGTFDASYADGDDPGDTSSALALIDTWGVVFDSRTGVRLNGARVRLVNAATGLPAEVAGDDGASAFPAEVQTGNPVTDSAGTIYELPDGVYRFPLIVPGNYRLVVEPPPGYVFPTTLQIPELTQVPGGPYRLHEGSFGRDFAIANPSGVAVDLPLDPVATELFIQKRTAVSIAAIGDFVPYELTVENTSTAAAVARLRIVDQLPPGLRYRAGSTRIDGVDAGDPGISADGRTLTFETAALTPGASVRIRYVTEITVGARGQEIANSAQAFGPDGSGSNVARAVTLLREELFRERAILMGRVVEGDCAVPTAGQKGVAGIRVYLEDGRNSTTDTEGKYHFDDVAPGAHVVQLDTITIPDGLAPLACDKRPREAGRAASQFVDVRGGTLWRADFRLAALPAGESSREPEPAAGRAQDEVTTGPETNDAEAPSAAIDIASLEPGTGWELPRESDVPPIPSIKVAIRHLPTQQVELQVNGMPVHRLNFDGAELDERRSVALSRWRGIELKDGANELMAIVRDEEGREMERLERRIHYAGGAVRAELVRESSRLVADGRTRPVIALRMTDAYGSAARPGSQGAWQIEPPHRSWWEVESLHENKLIAVGNREPTFRVDEDGLARLELEPTTQAGLAIIELRFNERHRQEFRVWLEPEAREWILVGLAEGSAAWNRIGDNLQPAAEAGIDEGYEADGRLAFFAKGVIKGEFLLTAAYDSAKDREEAKRRLLGVVDPNRFYTLYGDATEQRFEASSVNRLFLKLERRQFAALFGDYETGLTVTELTRYSRTMSGFKADYAGEHFAYTAFGSDSEQGFVRDDLQGDGTSGLYRLSRRPLIINSDKIRIEVRDRFRSERVLESRTQTRFLDYDIDYLGGTLFFKRPVPSRDADFNPVFIVAEYEVLNGGESEITAGGRTALKSADETLELGASYVQEGGAAGASTVGGLDLRWQIDDATELRAEVAQSESDDPAQSGTAGAHLAELVHVSSRLDARAYVREQEPEFGVGQQAGSESGTRKIGGDGRYRIGDQIFLEGELYRQTVLVTGAERDLASVAVRRETDDHTLGVGLRHVADSGLGNGTMQSELASLTGSVDLLDDRVVLRASQDLPFGGEAGSVDFPARSLVGVDYHWRPGSTLFAEYEHADGAAFESDMTRVGLRTMPWERAQLQSSMTQQATEFGPRVFANVGLTQGWQIDERWGIDVGVDQSNTIRGPDLEPFNPAQPLASGTLADDFTAAFVGAQYRGALWSFTSRIEGRQADLEDRMLLSAGLYREPMAGHGFSMAVQLIDSEFATGVTTRLENVEFSWVHRPAGGEWILLDRLDLKRDTQDDALDELRSARIINNLNANWHPGLRTQLGFQLGARYVTSTFDGEQYDGLSGVLGLEMRRNFDERFDWGVHATSLHSPDSRVDEYALGADFGVSLARDLWISIGYNLSGFNDADFSASGYTAQGPYIRFRARADQDSLKDLSREFQRPMP